ncbi:MAG: KH domain-containing protein [Clostridiales bacterium]|nr:KH domain-containing protein [Clostridiales bacterium]
MTIEVTAKKVDDAISQGLKQLGASLDEVNVEVVEAGGLFRKAKVRITLEREEKQPSQTDVKRDEPTVAESAEKKPAQPEKTQTRPENKSAKPAQPVKKQAQAKNDKAPSEENRSAKNVGEKSGASAQDRKPKSEGKKQPQAQNAEQSADGASNVAAQSEGGAETAKRRKPSAEDKLAAEHALAFIKEVTEKMGFEGLTVAVDESGENISITAAEGDDSLIIGRHGETLSALSYLAETCARAEKSHISITVDCNGYRERRAASLTAMARRRANECAAKRRKIKLEPMERVDRRTVHNALTDDDRVTTASEGKEPYRCVVIIPKTNKNDR